jgi:hypothetical protein
MKAGARGPSYVFSADIQQAAFNLWGRSSDASIARAMKNSKSRALLQAEQIRLALQQKARSTQESPP